MRFLGADLGAPGVDAGELEATLVALDPYGRVAEVRRPVGLPALARDVGELVADEAFTLGAPLPLVAGAKGTKSRPVEGIVRRRLGVKLPAAARLPGGEAFLAALGAAGHPCLPWPDRDRRRSGVAETWPAVVAKVLLWQGSPAAGASTHPERDAAFRGYETPSYRAADAPRASWPARAAALDLVLRGLAFQEDLDLQPAHEALSGAASDPEVERAGAILDATLAALAARRYVESVEECVFLGDREAGYTVLPADGFVRRLALRDGAKPGVARLFAKPTLRDRLAPHAEVRSMELVGLPGRPQRIEAIFSDPPAYEFDNLDEMLWWKHTRHLGGAEVPTDGLQELVVRIGEDDAAPSLRLRRSRHRVLSFRFDPPASWRGRISPRDGKTYGVRMIRAVYEIGDTAN